jgi:hypothetical protein
MVAAAAACAGCAASSAPPSDDGRRQAADIVGVHRPRPEAIEPEPDIPPLPKPQYNPEPGADPCDQLRRDEETTVGRARRHVEETTCSASLWIDGLFGDKADVAAARSAYGKIQLATFWSQHDGLNARLRGNARLQLPNMEDRFSLFVGKEAQGDIAQDRSQDLSLSQRFPQFDDRDETVAGLGYSLPSSQRFRKDFRAGIRFGGVDSRLFAQTRFDYNAYADPRNLLFLRGTPFVDTMDGAGFTTRFEYAHLLSDSRLLRLGNVATVAQRGHEGVDWRSALTHYQRLRKLRGVAYEVFVRGQTDAEVPLQEYGAQTVYRRPILGRELIGEYSLGYSWPRIRDDEQREGSVRLGVNLEMPFGREGR